MHYMQQERCQMKTNITTIILTLVILSVVGWSAATMSQNRKKDIHNSPERNISSDDHQPYLHA